MSRSRIYLNVLLVISVTVIGVAGLTFGRDATRPDLFAGRLVLKWFLDPGFAGEIVAKQKGFFEQEGLDISLQPGGFQVDPIRLVVSGGGPFGVTGADTFLIARAKGIPIVAVAAGYIQTAVALYVHPEQGISGMSDMIGKKVGVQAGQDTETLFFAMLGKAGIRSDQVKKVPVAFDLTPFLDGQVDVWPGYVATQSYSLRTRGVKFAMIRPRDVGINAPGTVYFTSETFLKEHPDIVKKFVRAVFRGWVYTYANIDDAAAIISAIDPKSLPLDLVKDNINAQRDQIIPTGYQYGELRLSDWESLDEVLFDEKLIQRKVDLLSALRPVY